MIVPEDKMDEELVDEQWNQIVAFSLGGIWNVLDEFVQNIIDQYDHHYKGQPILAQKSEINIARIASLGPI